VPALQVAAAHASASSADFLIREGEAVRKLVLKLVEFVKRGGADSKAQPLETS
jgi:hypothetical protein